MRRKGRRADETLFEKIMNDFSNQKWFWVFLQCDWMRKTFDFTQSCARRKNVRKFRKKRLLWRGKWLIRGWNEIRIRDYLVNFKLVFSRRFERNCSVDKEWRLILRETIAVDLQFRNNLLTMSRIRNQSVNEIRKNNRLWCIEGWSVKCRRKFV